MDRDVPIDELDLRVQELDLSEAGIVWVAIIRSGSLNRENAEPAVSAACNGTRESPSAPE